MINFKRYLEETKEVGYVSSFLSPIAFVSGLPGLRLDELVVTENRKRGMVYGLRKNLAEVLMIESEGLELGERVARTGETFKIGVSEEVLGRIVNPFLDPLDEKGPIRGTKILRDIRSPAPPLIERKIIRENLETGVMVVDLLVPIGYGQRELVIGDAKTGKTTFLLQAIVSQAKKGVICVYVGIGKKDTAIKYVEEYLIKTNVRENVVIIHTTPDDSPTLIYLAPYCGMAVGEYFRDKGKRVLIIFDDLTTHAKIYRQISLLLKRTPGRDCYPGEIFHLHASLLERAGNIKTKNGEVSITALPVAETLENDISGYIQTNLMAMTDGHIFFDINEFRKGKRPAVNAFLSVSRVGNQTKSKIEKDLARWVRMTMIDYQRVSEFVRFETELSSKTQEILEKGQRMELLFNQTSESLISRETQIILMGLLFFGFWKNKSLREMKREIQKILSLQRKNILPSLGVPLIKIKDFEHLKFLIGEIMPVIEENINKF